VSLHAAPTSGSSGNHEDTFLADPERGLAIVPTECGHAAGDVASKITVETIAESLRRRIRSARSSRRREKTRICKRSVARTDACARRDAGRDAHGDGYDLSFSGSAPLHTSLTSR